MHLALLVLLAFLVGCDAPAGHGPRAYVSNERDGTVSVIDLAKREVISTIEVGERPRGVRITSSGMSLLVAHAGDGDGGKVALIDLETEDVVRQLRAGEDPTYVDLHTVSVVVGDGTDAQVAMSDVAGGMIRARLPAAPGALATAPDEESVWVTSTATSTVDVVDTSYAERIASIPVGRGPGQLAFSRDGRHAFVVNTLDASVSVIDVARRKVTATISLPGTPAGLTVARDAARAYVATDAGLAVIDTAEACLDDVIPAARARALAVGPDGLIYAAGAEVEVIDPAARAVIATIPVGAQPWGITIDR